MHRTSRRRVAENPRPLQDQSVCSLERVAGALFWRPLDRYHNDGNRDRGTNGGLRKTDLMAHGTSGGARPAPASWLLACRGPPHPHVLTGTSGANGTKGRGPRWGFSVGRIANPSYVGCGFSVGRIGNPS